MNRNVGLSLIFLVSCISKLFFIRVSRLGTVGLLIASWKVNVLKTGIFVSRTLISQGQQSTETNYCLPRHKVQPVFTQFPISCDSKEKVTFSGSLKQKGNSNRLNIDYAQSRDGKRNINQNLFTWSFSIKEFYGSLQFEISLLCLSICRS